MTSLPDWLGRQLKEDERIARSTDGSLNRNANYGWTAEPVDVPGDDEFHKVTTGRGYRVGTGEYSRTEAEHIALHDPARVLLEIEAKRQLLVLHRPVTRTDFRTKEGAAAGPMVACHECDANTNDADWPDYPCWTLRFLALPYADRPGYEDDWRP
jgi:hypothetical protein